MKEKNFKKLGFFSSFSICIGSMVGIGIFFKNGSIAQNVGGNGIAWISSWIIAGLIALLVAIHFGKIALISNDGQPGLSSWSQRIASKKENWFRHAVTTNYSFFYNSIMIVVLSFFTVEIFADFLNKINNNVKIPIYLIAIISVFLASFYVILNSISIKFSGSFSFITTVLKFVPLIIAMFVGIILPNSHNSGGTNGFIPNDSNNSVIDSFSGIMKSLPAALFAFDAFVGIGSMAKKIKGGEKMVSKVIVFSMLFVVISYLLISISAILHYNPEIRSSVDQIIIDIFPADFAKGLSIFVIFFLFISAAGTTNAIAAAAVSEFENISKSEKIFFSKQLNNKFGYKKTALIYMLSSLFIWFLIAYIPAIVTNSDAFIDGLSNFPVLFFFCVYATLILLYWKNIFRKKKNKTEKRPWLYTILVFTSVSGVFISMTLNIIFVMIDAIQNPFGNSSWGFLQTTTKISNLIAFILHIVFAIIFLLLPLTNYLLFKIKKQNNIFEDIDIEVANHKIKEDQTMLKS